MNDEHGTDRTGGVEEGGAYIAPPGWPKWIGIVTIVYATILLGCTGIGAAFAPLQGKMMEPLLDGAPMPDGMKLSGLDWAFMGLGLVFTIILLFGGIFCVMRRPVCRWMLVFYGVCSIPVSLWSYVRQLEKQESIRVWVEQYPDTQLAEMMRMQQQGNAQAIGEMVGLVMILLLGVLVPLFYLIWFGFVKTKPEQYEGSDVGVY